MKVEGLIPAILLMLWSTPVNAIVNVTQLPSVVDAGKTYLVTWNASMNYTYNIWLVLDDPTSTAYEWTKVQTLQTGIFFPTLNGGFRWTVPSNLSASGDYGIWFGCFPIAGNTTIGSMYTQITNYFKVSNSSLASASASASATASRTSAVSSSASLTGSAAATSNAASHNAASSSHNNSLSGGAITGIVIGILALIALVVAAVIIRKHRKKRNDLEQREAAARANRLDPVMKVGQSSFEMQGRGLHKETNV